MKITRTNYNAVAWYARAMKREYMRSTIADGVDVKSISGIVRINDHECRVTFTDPDADYISILNRPLLSSNNYRNAGKGSGRRYRVLLFPLTHCGRGTV